MSQKRDGPDSKFKPKSTELPVKPECSVTGLTTCQSNERAKAVKRSVLHGLTVEKMH